MTESYLPWLKPPNKAKEVYVNSLLEDDNGLTLEIEALGGEGGRKDCRVEFGRVVAFRRILEESCHGHSFPPAKSGLWIVRDSEWLKEFSSVDLIHYPDPVHFLVVTSDERIDVISSVEPSIGNWV